MSAPTEVPEAPTRIVHKLWEHLMEYPTLAEAHLKTMEIKWVKPVKVAMGDSFDVVCSVQPIKYVAESCDSLVDSGLNLLDSHVPLLKTAELCDLTEPVVQPFRTAHFFVVKTVVEPAAKHVNDTRILVHSVFSENKATDTVKKVTSPVFGLGNSVLATTCLYVLPSIDMEPSSEMSEMDKTKYMLSSLVHNRKKAAVDTTEDVPAEAEIEAEA